jgi:hypothetical protein
MVFFPLRRETLKSSWAWSFMSWSSDTVCDGPIPRVEMYHRLYQHLHVYRRSKFESACRQEQQREFMANCVKWHRYFKPNALWSDHSLPETFFYLLNSQKYIRKSSCRATIPVIQLGPNYVLFTNLSKDTTNFYLKTRPPKLTKYKQRYMERRTGFMFYRLR